MAAVTGRDQTAMLLPALLAEYLDWRRRVDDKITITTIALDTARRLGDRHSEAAALNTLGSGRYEEAITACKDAVAIFRETRDVTNEAIAQANLDAAIRARRA